MPCSFRKSNDKYDGNEGVRDMITWTLKFSNNGLHRNISVMTRRNSIRVLDVHIVVHVQTVKNERRSLYPSRRQTIDICLVFRHLFSSGYKRLLHRARMVSIEALRSYEATKV